MAKTNQVTLLCKADYEAQIATTRDGRMAWWREARYGLFVHIGLYSAPGRQEWLQMYENIPVSEYEKFAEDFNPRPGAAREWCALAKEAGMKYAVLTTRHHEGFSLWDSKANPFNAMNYGPKRDIVREFVDACREFDLKIGFYSSLMDWHHPDGWRCAFDMGARRRFLDYIEALNTELLTNYGKIDILWYDVARPMTSWEGWDSVALNQRLRALQPDIIINNRSLLDEDFGTPEERIVAESARDWEACMTFNGLSWGYVDEEQVRPYSYNAQQILKMLHQVTLGGGNLLLNIGPKADGSIPAEAIEPLKQVGAWLRENGEAVYGKVINRAGELKAHSISANGVSAVTVKENTVYVWNRIWSDSGTMTFGGFINAPKRVAFLKDDSPIAFRHQGHRIILENLPKEAPDTVCGITVIKMEYDTPLEYRFGSYYPQCYEGQDIAGENKV